MKGLKATVNTEGYKDHTDNLYQTEFPKQVKELDYLAPDDSGRLWKPPHLWTAEQIHQLVMDNLGMDVLFARGCHVLVMLYTIPEIDETGLAHSQQEVHNSSIESCGGLVLRMGKDAFADAKRFPSGPTVTYGEWGIFRVGQRQPMNVNGKVVAMLHDDRFVGPTDDPSLVQTGLKLEFDYANQ